MPFDLGIFAANLIQQMPNYPIVGGGLIVDAAGQRHHIFTATSSFQIIKTGVNSSYAFDMLVVAGGGGAGPGAGTTISGAGGAGGLISTSSWALRTGVYSVTVGAGGAVGSNGNPSVFGPITATGGGRGGVSQAPLGESGQPGGSGGGGGSPNTYMNPGSAGGTGIAGQGFPGSGAYTFNWTFAGGGGGSGSASGGNPNPVGGGANGGIGGTGTYFAKYITMPFTDPTYPGHYASGGTAFNDNGFSWTNSRPRQPGGGGSVYSQQGFPGTGGGGGGASGGNVVPGGLNTGSGGGGIIILSYPFP